MFLFLSKFIPQFIYPLGSATLLLIIALMMYKHPSVARWLTVGALLILGIGGNKMVARELVRSLEWRVLPAEVMPQAEAIILLGGGTAPASYPRPMVEMSEAGDRVLYAAWLYHQGKAPVILVTGGVLPWAGAPSTPADDMKELLIWLNVPAEAIWVENQSANTYENALLSKEMLESAGMNHILLVTSAMHMPRSVMLFEKQGMQVSPAPTDFNVTRSEGIEGNRIITFLNNLLPSTDSLQNTTLALREYLGLMAYRLRGWI